MVVSDQRLWSFIPINERVSIRPRPLADESLLKRASDHESQSDLIAPALPGLGKSDASQPIAVHLAIRRKHRVRQEDSNSSIRASPKWVTVLR